MVAKSVLALVLSAAGTVAQSAPRPKFDAFDVATIKPVEFDAKGGRYIKMDGLHRFVEKAYTVKLLIAAAYDLNPNTVLGGPGWMDSDHYDIVAVTPGDVQPNHAEQVSMLRNLLADRFKLTFHREQKELSSYVLEVSKGGPKLKPSTLPPEAEVKLISIVYPQRIVMPARNATMGDFASLLQRAVMDRPVVDRTGLTGRYDFDLEWSPDETQFGGGIPAAPADAAAPPLFTAMQEQLGLRLYAAEAPVPALVMDAVERPSAN